MKTNHKNWQFCKEGANIKIVFSTFKLAPLFSTNSSIVLMAQDEEFDKILEDLDCSKLTSENANSSDENRLSGYFFFRYLF